MYHPATAADVNEAILHYNKRRSTLGDQFRSEIYAAVERVLANPYQYPVVEQEVRRCLVRRFPYSVLFRVIDDEIVRVLVIRHHRRRPQFGLRRI